jgi:hypothetical protein
MHDEIWMKKSCPFPECHQDCGHTCSLFWDNIKELQNEIRTGPSLAFSAFRGFAAPGGLFF